MNTIILAMERPTIPPWSTERKLLIICNHLFTLVFTMEMAMKAVAFSLIIGENCYFSDNWNRMDGTLVIVGLIDTLGKMILMYIYIMMKILNYKFVSASPFVGNQNKIFGMLRLLRLFKVLKPLRVIHRAPGLKLVVQSLLISLKPIGNIVLICCTFFLIFGILGVQVILSHLLTGRFYSLIPD